MDGSRQSVTLNAYAKINLSLEVLGKRDDGYHDLRSVMQTVSLADRVTVRSASRLSCDCSDPSLSGEGNLAYQAAALFRTHSGWAISIDKRVPAAAGLGGGSSDAAATLVAVNRLEGSARSCATLSALACDIGSDVPFFLTGGTALIEGRGERVTPLAGLPRVWYLLVKPEERAATRDVFSAVTRSDWSDGAATSELVSALTSGREAGVGMNGLTRALFALVPAARQAFDRLDALAPGRTLVSGSGPTVYAAFADRPAAERAERALAPHGYWTAVVHPVLPPVAETPCRCAA